MPSVFKILLVEDSSDDVEFFSFACSISQYHTEIYTCTHAEEALKTLKEGIFWPHFIVLDWNLPKISGGEFLSMIKVDPALKRIPVLVMTTSRRPEDIRQAYDNHCTAYLRKNFDFDLCSDELNNVFLFFSTVILPHV